MSATLHINPDVVQTLNWIAKDLCMFCGNPRGTGTERYACFCRHCDSCSSRWVAQVRKDLNEGRPPEEDCPNCLVPEVTVIASEELKATIFGRHFHPCPGEHCKGASHPCFDDMDCQVGPRLCIGCIDDRDLFLPEPGYQV